MIGSMRRRPGTLLDVLLDEGLRLFFPLSALQAAAWPVLWVIVQGFDLPFARDLPPSLWHGHEMLVGAWGAALIGFLTTALPEFSDTPRLRGRPLIWLAAAWGVARVVGLLGADVLGLVAGLADLAWIGGLVAYGIRVSILKRTLDYAGFAAWLTTLAATEAFFRFAAATGDVIAAQTALRLVGLTFLGFLGLALARISVPVTNLALDPSEETSPWRPHPGRRNLAPGLVAVALAGEIAALEPAVSGWLWIAAGAAFLDRAGETFVGRAFFRLEILALFASAAVSGLGLVLVGAGRLGAPWPESAALHVALQGGLGVAVMAVLAIAGLFHTGRPLPFPRPLWAAFAAILAATALRTLPDLGLIGEPPGGPHALASLLWAAGFLVWLAVYWPYLAETPKGHASGC